MMMLNIAFPVVASLLATFAQPAQACNPLTTQGCSPVPALGGSMRETFQNGLGPYFNNQNHPGSVTTGSDGLSITLEQRFQYPGIVSNFYMMFGYVEVVMKAAPGQGIVSSFFLQSDDLDEIDIELFGGDNYEFQSNYFVKGSTTTYDRGEYHDIHNPVGQYNSYVLDWNSERLNWIFNKQVMRTLHKDGPQGYPQSPMKIFAGIWAGGDPSNAPGTIAWAGGNPDYSQAPFSMHIQSITAIDYSTGDSYSYSDQSGLWTSIRAENGQVNGRQSEGEREAQQVASGGSIASNAAVHSLSSSDESSSSSSASPSPSELSSSSESSSSSTAASSSALSSSSSSASVSSSILSSSSQTSSAVSSPTSSPSSSSSSAPSTTTTTSSSSSSSSSETATAGSSVSTTASSTTTTQTSTSTAPSVSSASEGSGAIATSFSFESFAWLALSSVFMIAL
ncbi:uncharacterized protein LODBEIA_P48890 [Lodderomyces beijingensis]|uniref:Crh-like protein n=1 Tax=Lodderomyces beijingensis TaxID=1775926 RepID=A0ABP0ZVW6_9ASCO